MIHANVLRAFANGETAPSFTDLGGYPLVYICQDSETVCAKCINTVPEFHSENDPQWNVEAVDVNWEDDSIYCASCNEAIPAAYTD
jgi:hypothetical protein